MVISVILLSVSLSVDALFVGFAYGLDGTRIPLRSKLVVCLMSILYAGVAVFAGSTVSKFIPHFVGQLIGAGILALIGLWMIIKSLLKRKHPAPQENPGRQGESVLLHFIIKPLNITVQILKTPGVGDVDRSGVIDTGEAILVGSALSFDAIGVGIGSALSGMNGWYIPLAIGLCQLIFLSFGLLAGSRFSVFKQLDEKYTAIIPGAFLIVLSVLRLV
jgi:putative sporulation protein YtaF